MDCSLPVSSVHGILQARILEWVAISFSKEQFSALSLFLPNIYNELLLLFLLSCTWDNFIIPSNVNRVLDSDFIVKLRWAHCYKQQASGRLQFNEAISKQLRPLFAVCLCLQIQHNFMKTARKWQESKKITHNSRDRVKSNCHRLFLRQFEMPQETGTFMRVYKVRITAARQTHFPPVIPPLKPSILDSTAVIKKNKTKQTKKKLCCPEDYL